MKIQKIISQHRRDFHAIYECEGCGAEQKSHGYDDANFHNNVIPNKKCTNCGKSAIEIGADVRPLAPRYPANHIKGRHGN